MLVLMAGGGTAGHTSPLIATADALRRLDDSVEVVVLGTAEGLEARLVPEAGYRLEIIPRVPFPRRVGADLLALPFRLGGAVRAAQRVVDRLGADVVAGFGGYVSPPAYLAARRRRIPIVVHEGNALPGLANRLGARLTRHVATSFPDTPLPHAEYVGLPIRRMISTLDRGGLRARARQELGLDQDRPTLLVTGGSQGARRINEAVSGAQRALADAGVQVLHVCGPLGEVSVGPGPGDPPYVVVPYVDRMDLAYAAADLVICRAGAGSVTEAAGVGLPAVFVPLPIGNGEQALNARALVDAGAALIVDDAELTPAWVARTLPALATDTGRLARMSGVAAGLMRRDADERLARMILAAGGGR
jgi:UDP-N-acetylglucosamine--N-acetylmuramyl-(pentapeptide) pyrophosphoryl-undecaprenol N-acetylglucosamine transferase